MSANKLPPLPPLPNADLIVFDGELQGCLEGVKMTTVLAYGQQCYSRGYQQAKEDAALLLAAIERICESALKANSRYTDAWTEDIRLIQKRIDAIRAMKEPSHD